MALAREIVAGLERCLHGHAGFELPAWVVESRAVARMSALSLGPQAYLELVRAPRGAAELHALVEAVRVGETRFFRHRPQVDALLEVVVPTWRERTEGRAEARRAPGQPRAVETGDRAAEPSSRAPGPRVWSAGCATGEEAYTLALVLGRALPRGAGQGPSILATDVSAEALATARRGIYPAAALEQVPEPWRGGLICEGEVVRVRPEVAALVSFERGNLADAEGPRGFDLVWCRNVLIYFGPEARKRVLEKLVAALEPGGFLFLGYSETLRHVAGLRAVRHGEQILWQKLGAGEAAAAARAGEGPRPGFKAARADEASAGALSSRKREVAAGGPPRGEEGGAMGATERTREVAPGGPQRGDAGALSRRSEVPVTPVKAVAVQPRGAAAGPVKVAAGAVGERARAGAAREPSAGQTLRLSAAEPATLAADLRAALGTRGVALVTVDLDAAEYLGDEIAPVLRRAVAAAESAGIELQLRATRPGPQRWLRRNDLMRGDG